MTKALRDSKFCTGKAKFTSEGISFGCQNELSSASEEDRNFLTCVFWDMSLDEKCVTCPLKCDKNKNQNLKQKQIEIKELNKILSSMNNFGITAEYAHSVVDKHKKSGGMNPEALKALGLSNAILNKGMSGQMYDISHFQYIMRDVIKNLKKK